MASSKVRHDFAAGEEVISAGSTQNTHLSNARDESSSLHKTNIGALGEDVAGSEQVASIAQTQFERDTLGIDSAARMHSGNQHSQEIQQGAADRATRLFSNRG